MKMLNKIKNKSLSSSTSKRVFCVFALFAIAVAIHAQGGPGAGAIAGAANTFKQYQEPVKSLLYAISGIIALIGGFTIFTKMQNGDQDVKKSILMVVGSCVALLALAQALPAFFN